MALPCTHAKWSKNGEANMIAPMIGYSNDIQNDTMISAQGRDNQPVRTNGFDSSLKLIH
jgi:hypothetical protein